MKAFALVLCLLTATKAQAFDHEHMAWTALLQTYQTDAGLVRYQQLKADAISKSHAFNLYLAGLTKVGHAEFDGFTKPQKIAFLLNAYNAFTIKLILDNYPVASIRKIGGLFTKPWAIEFFSLLGGAIKALDPIEHKWLRPIYKDYRIHAAVNCASVSCPPLRHEAYSGTRLEAQLNEQMTLWLADATRNRYDSATGAFHLSKIFDWYASDFDEWGGGVRAVVTKFGPEAAKTAYAKKVDVDFLDYDWDLNEAK